MSQPATKRLRKGFTTGAAAAAAAKGALQFILDSKSPQKVAIDLLTGRRIEIPLRTCRQLKPMVAECTVIKDAGDDPDITHRAVVGAKVTLTVGVKQPVIKITGGVGVGRVTKPGLSISPGEAAITRGPRKMITQAIQALLTAQPGDVSASVEVFVPAGERLARKTLNARLGILGGISILGTTGEVRPLSHAAYVATIESALSVARAAGNDEVVLTTGRRSERFAQGHWDRLAPEAFVQIGDFFKESLQRVDRHRFKRVILAVFFGKAVKMAQGIPHTHARSARLTLEQLAQWAFDISGEAGLRDVIAQANTARHAFDLLKEDHPQVIERVGREIVVAAGKFVGAAVHVRAVIFNFDGDIFYDSDEAV